MIGSGEAESRAVAGAVKGAVGQFRLDAGVNITGLLVDIDRADSVDCRQYFMCWHLTRILRTRGMSLTKKPAEKGMLHRSLATPPSPPARRAASTTWFLNLASESALVSPSQHLTK